MLMFKWYLLLALFKLQLPEKGSALTSSRIRQIDSKPIRLKLLLDVFPHFIGLDSKLLKFLGPFAASNNPIFAL